MTDPDKEVYNGDISFVEDRDLQAGKIIVHFDGRSATYKFGELHMLVPAYAATIHKSQRWEFPAVIIQIMTSITPCCSEICSTPGSHVGSV